MTGKYTNSVTALRIWYWKEHAGLPGFLKDLVEILVLSECFR